MPIWTTVAVAGAGLAGAGLSANAAAKGAKGQANAALEGAQLQTDAANRAADMQQQNFNTIRDDLSPYRALGGASVSPYMALLGIGGGSPSGGGGTVAGTGTPGTAAVAQSGGGPDWAAYLAQYPDVSAGYQKELLTPQGRASLAEKGITSPETYAAWHYATMGNKEARQVTNTPIVPGTAATAGTPAQTMTPEQSAAYQAQQSANQQAALENIPGYKFVRDQGMQAVTNSVSARGLGGVSGAFGKGLARFVTGLADTTYGDQVARQLEAVKVGQNAAVQTGSAGTTAATNAGNALIGGATAGAAGQVGAANANAAGQVGVANALTGGINAAVNGLYSSQLLKGAA